MVLMTTKSLKETNDTVIDSLKRGSSLIFPSPSDRRDPSVNHNMSRSHFGASILGTTEFDMSDARRTALVEAGRSAIAAYFDATSAKRGSAKALKTDSTKRTRGTADRIALRLLL